MALSKDLKEIVEYRGVERLVAAEVLTDNNETGEGYTTGAVFSIAGVAEVSRSTESGSETKFYDNMPALVITSTGADEITCTVSAIDMEVLAEITGQQYDATTGAFIEGQRDAKYFALGYITKKTNGDLVYVWRYKGTFGIPESTHVTETDGTDSNGQEVVFTGISTTHKFDKVTDKKGNKRGAKAMNVDLAKDSADVTEFFDTVTTPDDLQPKP
jgi:phi13 family phage major tail protein